jgi:hypothetical protein
LGEPAAFYPQGRRNQPNEEKQYIMYRREGCHKAVSEAMFLKQAVF